MALGLMESYLGADVNTGFDPELARKQQAILAQLFAGQGGGDESDTDRSARSGLPEHQGGAVREAGDATALARHSFGVFAHMGIRILLGSNAPSKSCGTCKLWPMW